MHRKCTEAFFFLRSLIHTRTSHKSAASPELHSPQANPWNPKTERLGTGSTAPGETGGLFGEAQAPEPFGHFLTSPPPHLLLSLDSVGPSIPVPSQTQGPSPPWVPGLLPPGRAERSQGAGWFRALRSGCADKLGSDSGWRNVAQGLPGQVRPPHTPRSWQGTGQSGHSAAGPDTSPVHPPRSSSAAPPLREGGLVTGSCPPHPCNWVKD